MKRAPIFAIFVACAAGVAAVQAQMLNPAPAQPAPAGSQPSPGAGNNSSAGKSMPSFDPGSEIVTWDGKSWNINNNRLLQARFEKYLNSPEEGSQEDSQYNAVIANILSKLSPVNTTPKSLDEAFQLLPKASTFKRDAQLCDAIANQVYSAWMSRRANDRLKQAQTSYDQERSRLERNQQVELDSMGTASAPSSDKAAQQWAKDRQQLRDMKMHPYVVRLAEVNAMMKATKAKSEVSELQSKVEFQALIVQLFFQRRFQHVLIATRFYRNIFTEGDTKLVLKGQAKNLMEGNTGMPPTVGTMDSMASEFIRDVSEGIEAYRYLLERDEMESASKRLAEAFVVGEYLPQIRTLPRDDKRRALDFVRKTNQLISAIEVKDYALAEKLVSQIEVIAKDFDNSKPMAAIQTAKTVAAMHLAKAKNAAVSGDRSTLEKELTEATQIWPRNPALAEVSQMIFSTADVQQKALVDFDQLLSQKNYRQIFDDKERFIAAAAQYPDRQDQLRKVLKDMTEIEGAIIRAQEIEKRGDAAGAWESAERAFMEFPDDSKLNQVRANLTTKAADFVHSLRRAEELEKRNQYGSSLAWYLKAQQQYPPSEFARNGIDRLKKQILPDAS